MIDRWTIDWSNPVFSIEERNRRWSSVRELMKRDGIDIIVCLPCTNAHNRGQADPIYLTQLGENEDEVTVAFPLSGEVTAWLSRGGVWPSSSWMTDIRPTRRGHGGQTVIGYLKEMGFQRSTIGIAGLTGGLLSHARQWEGEVNWQSVEMMKRAFPKANIKSATDLLGQARYQKSEEEIEFLRRGTRLAEEVLLTVINHARPGVYERDVFGHMMYTYASNGGSFTPMFGWTSGPLGKTYHRLEQPSLRRFEVGDVLTLEIESRWAGYAAQIDQAFSMGVAHRDLKEGMKLVWESYNRVENALKPGVTVGELLAKGRVKGMNGRGEAHLIMHGRGTGDDGPMAIGGSTPELLSLEMKEGCVMLLKPSALVNGKPDYGRWGETVVIRKDGGERLGKRCQELYELM